MMCAPGSERYGEPPMRVIPKVIAHTTEICKDHGEADFLFILTGDEAVKGQVSKICSLCFWRELREERLD